MIPERDFILLVDIGNTFLKWGLFRPSRNGTARDNRVESRGFPRRVKSGNDTDNARNRDRKDDVTYSDRHRHSDQYRDQLCNAGRQQEPYHATDNAQQCGFDQELQQYLLSRRPKSFS